MKNKPNKLLFLLMAGVCVAAIAFFNYQLFMLGVDFFKKLFGIQ